MRRPRNLILLCGVVLLIALPVAAQTGDDRAAAVTAGAPPTSGGDRLFLSFIEDATVVDAQWWEGRFEYLDGENVEIMALSGVAAFQPWKRWELGGRVGFADSDISGSLSPLSGSGATDLDVWGKYWFPGSDATEFAAGGVVTIPTGDDSAGLGFDSFGVGAFGAVRHRLKRLILSFNGGLRFNGDGKIFGFDVDGETSVKIGGGVIFPMADSITLVGELNFETERIDGAEDDFRVLGGVNWRLFNRGMLRGALGVGLSDGAPDWQILLGYAANF